MTRGVVILVTITIALQALGACLLPATRGFTAPLPTIATVIAFVAGTYGMARLITAGMNLSVVIPLMTCTVPFVILVVSIFIYQESASLQRIALLVTGTVLIAAANSIP